MEIKEIEIGQLILSYKHTRIHRPEALRCVIRTIERSGRINPVVALKEAPGFILIDGYLRIAALKRCGMDMVKAEIWQCRQDEAIIRVLMRSRDRAWELLEQALLIRELRDCHSLTQADIAHLMGTDQSWVSRRLGLLMTLPDSVLSLIQQGHISTWAATRVLAPMARAIPEHAQILARHLALQQIPTRELVEFFSHYKSANTQNRLRMVQEPVLFLKALQAKKDEQDALGLKEGPEGRWLKDLQALKGIIKRLIKDVAIVLYERQNTVELLTIFDDALALMLSLAQKIKEVKNDNRRAQTDDPGPASPWCGQAADQQDCEGIQERCP